MHKDKGRTGRVQSEYDIKLPQRNDSRMESSPESPTGYGRCEQEVNVVWAG